MKVLFWIYNLSAFITCAMLIAVSYSVTEKVKTYFGPTVFAQLSKANWYEKLQGFAVAAFVVLMPIVNTLFACIFVLANSMLKEETYKKMKTKYQNKLDELPQKEFEVESDG